MALFLKVAVTKNERPGGGGGIERKKEGKIRSLLIKEGQPNVTRIHEVGGGGEGGYRGRKIEGGEQREGRKKQRGKEKGGFELHGGSGQRKGGPRGQALA